ncbi:MAG: hypothetical protein GY773_16350 [Actinomycetia bacterium]|nr:hypothetical protein [Actinomycetes bacterium]
MVVGIEVGVDDVGAWLVEVVVVVVVVEVPIDVDRVVSTATVVSVPDGWEEVGAVTGDSGPVGLAVVGSTGGLAGTMANDARSES